MAARYSRTDAGAYMRYEDAAIELPPELPEDHPEYAASLEQARKLVREIYHEDFAKKKATADRKELANRMIENGRFAMQLLQNNLVHAGFWGSLRPGPATAIPNACPAAGDWANPAYTANLLAIPVQAFADGSTLGDCGVSGVLANSQVLVVSHANTCVAGAAGCLASGPHLQV